MNKVCVFIVLIAVSFQASFAQTLNKAKLDSLFNVLAENNKAMGSIALSKNGTILYTKSIGYSSINGEKKIPATEKTKYRIGSITKMFTATIVFQLIEEGKISLTTTLDKYFPTIPNAKIITVGNLLNHRSGIHSFTGDPDFKKWMFETKTKEEMVAIISKSKPYFKADEKAAYSNSNFLLLGYIIEDICKKPYQEVLQERIVSKTGLTNTCYGGKINPKNNESYSYHFMVDWKLYPESNMSIPGGAGAIVSTPVDLTKFITALFAGKLVSPASLLTMETMKENYGMGMFETQFNHKKVFWHNGKIDGFHSIVEYFPEDSFAIAYCTNGEAYDMNDILKGVLRIYFDEPYTIPTFKSISLSPEELNAYLGVYSSKQMSFKVTITKDKSTLIAKPTGQSSFHLDATEKDKFKFDTAGVVIEFNPTKNAFILKQDGEQSLFTKDH